jgi:hypothetical protein
LNPCGTHIESDLQILTEGLSSRESCRASVNNRDFSEESKYLPIPLSELAGQDLSELEAKAAAAAEAMKKEQEALNMPEKDPDGAEEDSKKMKRKKRKASRRKARKKALKDAEDKMDEQQISPTSSSVDQSTIKPKGVSVSYGTQGVPQHDEDEEYRDMEGSAMADYGSPRSALWSRDHGSSDLEKDIDVDNDNMGMEDNENENENENDDGEKDDKEKEKNSTSQSEIDGDWQNVIYLGLRVYTNREAPAVVNGQLRHEMATSFAGLAIDD